MPYDLKKTAGKVKSSRYSFRLLDGDKVGHLLITPKAPTKAQIAEIEEEIGESTLVAKGVCHREEEVLVFSTKAPPKDAWSTKVAKIFTKHKITNEFRFRPLRPDESEDGSASESESETESSDGGKPTKVLQGESESGEGSSEEAAEWAKLETVLSALKPRIMSPLLQQDAAAKTEVRNAYGAYTQARDAGDYATARASLGKIVEVTKRFPAPTGQQASGNTTQTTTPPQPQTTQSVQPPVTQPVTPPRPKPSAQQMNTARTANRAPVRRELPPRPPAFTQTFSTDALKVLKGKVDRGALNGGMGDFGDVFKRAVLVHEGLGKAAKEKNPDAYMIGKYDSLIEEAQKYKAKFNEDASSKKTGVFSRREGTTTKRDEKLEACDQMILKATEARARLALKSDYMVLDALEKKNAATGLQPDEEERFHNVRAGVFMKSNPVSMAKGGMTDDLALLRDFDGSIAYAFKGIKGEPSKATGLPRGGGAAREVLSSVLAEQLEAKTGLKMGYPKSTIATLPGKDGKPSKGALIQGIAGEPIEGLDRDGLDEQTNAELQPGEDKYQVYERVKANDAARISDMAKALPPKEVQRTLLLNLASGQLDAKWANVMTEDTPNGPVARPFDGGGGFPPDSMLKEFVDIGTDEKDYTVGGGLVLDPHDQTTPLPVSGMPIDPELVRGFANLNVDEVEANLLAEMERLKADNPEITDGAMDEKAISNGMQGLRALKAILAQNPTITTGEFVKAYNQAMNFAAYKTPPKQ